MTASSRTRPDRRLWRRIVLLIFLGVLLAVPSAGGPPSQPGTLAPALLLSGFERAGHRSIARDCGYSAPLPASPGRSLWLFCDTPLYVRNAKASGRLTWALQRFIPGSTAAVGLTGTGPGQAGRAPGRLGEVGTPGGGAGPAAAGAGPTAAGAGPTAAAAPAPFLPPPAGLVTPTGQPCGYGNASYAASWASGIARIPSTPDLLISFSNYCVLGGTGGFLPEGFGLVEYDPATGTLSNDVTVFTGAGTGTGTPGAGTAVAAAKLLGSPVFAGPYLYLFGPACTAQAHGGCATGTLFEARVRASALAWTNPLSYQWRSHGAAGQWTPDAAMATSIIAGATPSAVSVGDFSAAGHHFVLVEQTDISGAFTLYESAAPAGTWTRIRSGHLACQAGTGFANFCRAIVGHPELSTPAQLVLSYFDPGAGPRGHVMVAGFRW